MPNDRQPEMFPRPVEALYFVIQWKHDEGWSVDARARCEGESWSQTTLVERYERLSVDETLNILPDLIERLRGF